MTPASKLVIGAAGGKSDAAGLAHEGSRLIRGQVAMARQ